MPDTLPIASLEEVVDHIADALERQSGFNITSETARRRAKAILDGLGARYVRFYSNYTHCMLPEKISQ